MNGSGHGLRNRLLGILGIFIVISIMILVYVFKDFFTSYAAYGYVGLFVACVLSNATILLPAPSAIVVTEFALLYNPFFAGIIGGLGAAVGELTGFAFGKSGKQIVKINENGRILSFFNSYPSLIVFLLALVPLPLFDLAGIVAGASKMKILHFFFACCFGKIIKMLAYSFFSVFVIPMLPQIFSELKFNF